MSTEASLVGFVVVDTDYSTGEPRTMSMPERFDAIVERVMDRDVTFFAKNPERDRYTRPYVPGEGWPVFGSADLLVTVYRLWSGARLRYFHESTERPPRRFPLESLRGIGPEESFGAEVDERVRRSQTRSEPPLPLSGRAGNAQTSTADQASRPPAAGGTSLPHRIHH